MKDCMGSSLFVGHLLSVRSRILSLVFQPWWSMTLWHDILIVNHGPLFPVHLMLLKCQPRHSLSLHKLLCVVKMMAVEEEGRRRLSGQNPDYRRAQRESLGYKYLSAQISDPQSNKVRTLDSRSHEGKNWEPTFSRQNLDLRCSPRTEDRSLMSTR